MDTLRVERTLLHRKFGVFRYAEGLAQHGISTPSEQIVVIGRFIVDELGRATTFPRLSNDEAVERWMQQAIAAEISRLRQSGFTLEPLGIIALRAGFFIAWNPYIDFAELLSAQCGREAYPRVATRLRARGFDVALADLSALTRQFLRFRLPQAVRGFDLAYGHGKEAAWLATVFYRFTLNQLLSDRKNQQHLEILRLEAEVATIPEAMLEEQERERALSALPNALDRLPFQDRSALELYFGFHGREHTLAEVAQELGVSAYLARTAITRGLARLAALLGVPGPLDEEEFALLQLLLGEGMELARAAKQLQITPNHSRQVVARIGSKFRLGLRLRTTVPVESPG